MDIHGLGWDAAWSIVHRSTAYTNHTLLPEALETWPLPLVQRLLPRHVEIIFEINRRFLEDVRANLGNEIYALRSWYVALGDSFLHSTAIPPPHLQDTQGRTRLLECVRAAVSDGGGSNARSALVLLWANQHLDALWRLESHLGRLAAQASTSAGPGPA